MIHRGEIVKMRIEQCGFKQVEVYTIYPAPKNTFDGWLEQHNLSFVKILRIGAIIGYDFSKDFEDLKTMKYDEAEQVFILRESGEPYGNAELRAFKIEMRAGMAEINSKLQTIIDQQN